MPSDRAKWAPQAMEGIHNALIESHLPVCVITERDAMAGRWQGIRTLVIAESECLADDTISALETFVREGGGLVVTGPTSLCNGGGEPRKDFGLANLLGVHFEGWTKTYYTFLQPEAAHPITEGLELGFPLSVYRTRQVKVRPTKPDSVLGVVVDPMPGFHMGYPPLNRTETPALVARTFGKGRVCYAGASLGRIYLEYNHPDTRTLITNAVAWTAGKPPPVTARAPGTVEIVPWRDEAKRETIIHLLNRTAAGPAQGLIGPMIHETIPVHDVVVSVIPELAGSEARLQPSNLPLQTRTESGRVTVNVARLAEWETVVFS